MDFISHAGMSGPATPVKWYTSLPPVTKAVITAMFVTTLGTSLNLISPNLFTLDYHEIFYRFQVWRLIFPFFFLGKFSFSFVFFLLLFAKFSAQIEIQHSQNASKGAYLYFNSILGLLIIGIDLLLTMISGNSSHQYFLCKPYYFAIVFYWSKTEPWTLVNFWFGFVLKGSQLPYAMLIFEMLTGSWVWPGVVGMAAGYIIYLIKDVLPAQGGTDWLKHTPAFFDSLATMLDPAQESSHRESQTWQHPADVSRRQHYSGHQRFPGAGHRLGSAG